MTADLWVITSYFNPCRYRSKRENFDAFIAGMEEVGANVLTVELAFGDDEFELEPSDSVLQLRGGGVMWQKERLLNVVAAALPESCTKVGWFDGDLVFDDPDWLKKTSEALDEYAVVQPFSTAVRLKRGNKDDGTGENYESFAAMYVDDPQPAKTGEFFQHGHTGYAWAARRELFEECGLYDACLTGSGDHLMAHAFANAVSHSPCMPRMIGTAPRYVAHFNDWAAKVERVVDGKLGVVPGRVLHLWHGDLVDRRYSLLNQQFKTFDFDPDRDLRYDENGLWEWDQASAPMRAWANELFRMRNEDGELKMRRVFKVAP
jgi:8-oxo-dGTP pyrophosphatase MutT (NUDIX family)